MFTSGCFKYMNNIIIILSYFGALIVVKDEPDGMQCGIQHQFIVHANRIIIIIIFIKQMLRDDMLPLFKDKCKGSRELKLFI